MSGNESRDKYRYCKVCGAKLLDNVDFCTNCGTLVGAEQEEDIPQSPVASPSPTITSGPATNTVTTSGPGPIPVPMAQQPVSGPAIVPTPAPSPIPGPVPTPVPQPTPTPVYNTPSAQPENQANQVSQPTVPNPTTTQTNTTPPAKEPQATSPQLELTGQNQQGKKGSGASTLVAIIVGALVGIVLFSMFGQKGTSGTGSTAASGVQASGQASGQASATAASTSEAATSSAENTATPANANKRYELVKADISWSDAVEKCAQMGGHLVTISSQEEMDKIAALAEDAGIDFVWLGGTTSGTGADANGKWITGEPFTFSAWYKGEPSHADVDGTYEDCMEMWRFKSTGEWSWNDDLNNPLVDEYSSSVMSGNMGYVCEYD